MGSSSSRPVKEEEKSWGEQLKEKVKDEVAKQAMMQREVQMAINIAKARDSIQIFGSLWATLVAGVTLANIAKKPVPQLVYVPCLVGGIVLGNMADMAYGNKLQRVMREAEHIMENEKPRFIPPYQAPFAKFYPEHLKSVMYDRATPVGELYPSKLFSRNTPSGK